MNMVTFGGMNKCLKYIIYIALYGLCQYIMFFFFFFFTSICVCVYIVLMNILRE